MYEFFIIKKKKIIIFLRSRYMYEFFIIITKRSRHMYEFFMTHI